MIKYLKFTDEAQAKSVLAEFVDNNEWMLASNTHSLDLIGPLTVEDGTYDDEGNVITPPVIDSSYHVNFQGELSADVSAYEVIPSHPRRVWA